MLWRWVALAGASVIEEGVLELDRNLLSARSNELVAS